jgi:hypothetical protein
VFTVLLVSVSTPPTPFVQVRPDPFTVELLNVAATASEKSAARVTVTPLSTTDPAPLHIPPEECVSPPLFTWNVFPPATLIVPLFVKLELVPD